MRFSTRPSDRNRRRRGSRRSLASSSCVALLLAGSAGFATRAAEPVPLRETLGRNQTLVRSEPFPLVAGLSIERIRLAERLGRLGYIRVDSKPASPGQYFWGHDVFWIYLRAFRIDGAELPDRLLRLDLDRAGSTIARISDSSGSEFRAAGRFAPRLEPERLADSLGADRARTRPLRFDELPERVWRPVLAAEDSRFFEHVGLDGRAIARALLANLRSGGVEQGGSTITQQLIKNRDMTPRRSVGRKASEALRALALEADYDKREILEAYLDDVYLGHVDGLAIHGFGAAAHIWFSKPAAELTLAEAALLAAMIQAPNRLAPDRHAATVRARRDWVLDRMGELGWAGDADVRAARASPIRLRRSPPDHPAAAHFLRRVGAEARQLHPERIDRGRGVVVETTLDPWLQMHAESVVSAYLARLKREHRSLRAAPLAAALVALDAETGAILAYVGGDPARSSDEFDRAGSARRQPGSAIKPLLLLEAFQTCGGRDPLHPASRILDAALRIDLPSGAWEPENFDQRFRGVVTVRSALRDSLNVPFVRIARWCGLEATAERLRRAGVAVERSPPPSFALGAIETTAVELAGAFTVFATPGSYHKPHAVRRIERPSGTRLSEERGGDRKVVLRAAAWLVRDLLREVVESGSGRAAAIEGLEVVGKTGSSSSLRDAWFVGDAGNVVAAVWIGRDDDRPLGLTGGSAAAPLWREFMVEAARARPPRVVPRPDNVVRRTIDSATGLLLSEPSSTSSSEWFRDGYFPPRRRFWRQSAIEPIR